MLLSCLHRHNGVLSNQYGLPGRHSFYWYTFVLYAYGLAGKSDNMEEDSVRAGARARVAASGTHSLLLSRQQGAKSGTE